MIFKLTNDEIKKFNEWANSHAPANEGAIGGRYSFTFTPTSVGTFVSATDAITREEIHLTNYDDF